MTILPPERSSLDPGDTTAHTVSVPHNASQGNPTAANLRAVIILAGGTGRRLGGISKPNIVISGKRLVDHCLDYVPQTALPIVVAPESVNVNPRVIRLLEDPPLSGPACGLAAGWDYCRHALRFSRSDVIGLLPVDAPLAGYALQALTRCFRLTDNDGHSQHHGYPDSCLVARAHGHIQRCVAVFSPSALDQACRTTTRNISMRRFLERINVREVPVEPSWVHDIDTPDDIAFAEYNLTSPHLRPTIPASE